MFWINHVTATFKGMGDFKDLFLIVVCEFKMLDLFRVHMCFIFAFLFAMPIGCLLSMKAIKKFNPMEVVVFAEFLEIAEEIWSRDRVQTTEMKEML